LDDRGFVMVALLIGIAVSAIWMAALLPAWTQQETRERELEMIFRGEQYARAIYLYRLRNQAPPPNVDTLVNQKFLRKKYVDPMTGKDFVPVGGVSATPSQGGTAGPQVQAGITGVRSQSNETSIIVYANQQVHSQFPFDWTQEAQRTGVGMPQGGPGQRGGAGPGRDGRGGDGRGSSTPVTPGARGTRGAIDTGMPAQGGVRQAAPGSATPRNTGPFQPAPGSTPPGGGRR
jgi:type II secretory pathway pseudopilin PulG